MPTPLDFPAGAPIWMELVSRDLDASKAFYERLLGWTSTTAGPEFGGYVSFFLDGAMVGGMVPNAESETTPDAWRVYLETGDAATTATAIRDAEGDVVSGPHSVGDLGTMLLATDIDGATIAAWQRGLNQGFQVIAEPGAPAWFELHTTQFHDIVRFYQQSFGWKTATMADTPEFRYAQLMVDEQPYAGVMDASAYWQPGAPAQWFVYVSVTDTDSTIARAVELGGTVVDEPADTPFGRLSMIADPTGALIKLISSPV